MTWLLITLLTAVAWRLSQPELGQWLSSRLVGARRPRWSGSLVPSIPGLKLYQNPRDERALQEALSAPAKLISSLERLTARCALQTPGVKPSIEVRLSVTAQLIGELLQRGHSSARAADVRYVCEHMGLSHPLPNMSLVPLDPYAPEQLSVSSLEPSLLDALERVRVEGLLKLGVGIAQVKLSTGEDCLLLLTQPQPCELQPLPRHVMGQLGVQLSGRTLMRGELTLWLSEPSGQVRRIELERPAHELRGDFAISLPRLSRGVYRAELTLSPSRLPERAALDAARAVTPVSLMCASLFQDVKPPREHSLIAPARPSRFKALNRWRLLATLQRARRSLGLKPLKLSRALSAAAAELSEQHELYPTTPLWELPATRALVSSSEREYSPRDPQLGLGELCLIAEAWGCDLDDVAAQWLETPHQRAQLLDLSVTHIGLHIQLDERGRPQVLMALSARAERLQLSRDRREVYKLIQAYRRSSGVGRLPQDDQLEGIAQEAAEALSSGQCRAYEVLQHAQHLAYERLGEELPLYAEAWPLRQIEQLPMSESWTEQPLGLGVGLAQLSPEAPIWVVSLLRVRARTAIGDLSRIQAQLEESKLAEERRRAEHAKSVVQKRLGGGR